MRGTIRFTASLQKPFAGAARIAGITKQISAKAMRRTFQDITRASDVSSVVKRSISGHATGAMEGWYSTVAPDEQRAALAKVVSLLEHKASWHGCARQFTCRAGHTASGAPSCYVYEMSPKASDVMRQARELSDDERRELAIELLDSTVAPEVQAAWIDEVRKRVHDIDSGAVEPLSNEEALRLIAADD